MLDILSSPLRGYIAQTLQFYLSKYLKDIHLEGLGFFGNDLVLNDLEIKRHVLQTALDLPPTFDFSRGFIRELRIHIPWTQILSQPIEVKLYTVELILTAKEDVPVRQRRNSVASEGSCATMTTQQSKTTDFSDQPMEPPKSGWLQSTLAKILANISIQINNLVLKYEEADIVLSLTLGYLDLFSASDTTQWTRGFAEPTGDMKLIAKCIDAKDISVFLDRYTSDRIPLDIDSDIIHRQVVGYEVPVLRRTNISLRCQYALDQNPKPVASNSNFYTPQAFGEPFALPAFDGENLLELDIYVKELCFSLSDRQVQMLLALIQSKEPKSPEKPFTRSTSSPALTSAAEPEIPIPPLQIAVQPAKPAPSWSSWIYGAFVGADNDEDELEHELISSLKTKIPEPVAIPEYSITIPEDAKSASILTVRVSIPKVSLTLRFHGDEESNPSPGKGQILGDGVEYVPVANVGLVAVDISQHSKTKVSKAAPPIGVIYCSGCLLQWSSNNNQQDTIVEIQNITWSDPTTQKSILQAGAIEVVEQSILHPNFESSFFREILMAPGWNAMRSNEPMPSGETSCNCSAPSLQSIAELWEIAMPRLQTCIDNQGSILFSQLSDQILRVASSEWTIVIPFPRLRRSLDGLLQTFLQLYKLDCSIEENLELLLFPKLIRWSAQAIGHTCISNKPQASSALRFRFLMTLDAQSIDLLLGPIFGQLHIRDLEVYVSFLDNLDFSSSSTQAAIPPSQSQLTVVTFAHLTSISLLCQFDKNHSVAMGLHDASVTIVGKNELKLELTHAAIHMNDIDIVQLDHFSFDYNSPATFQLLTESVQLKFGPQLIESALKELIPQVNSVLRFMDYRPPPTIALGQGLFHFSASGLVVQMALFWNLDYSVAGFSGLVEMESTTCHYNKMVCWTTNDAPWLSMQLSGDISADAVFSWFPNLLNILPTSNTPPLTESFATLLLQLDVAPIALFWHHLLKLRAIELYLPESTTAQEILPRKDLPVLPSWSINARVSVAASTLHLTHYLSLSLPHLSLSTETKSSQTSGCQLHISLSPWGLVSISERLLWCEATTVVVLVDVFSKPLTQNTVCIISEATVALGAITMQLSPLHVALLSYIPSNSNVKTSQEKVISSPMPVVIEYSFKCGLELMEAQMTLLDGSIKTKCKVHDLFIAFRMSSAPPAKIPTIQSSNPYVDTQIHIHDIAWVETLKKSNKHPFGSMTKLLSEHDVIACILLCLDGADIISFGQAVGYIFHTTPEQTLFFWQEMTQLIKHSMTKSLVSTYNEQTPIVCTNTIARENTPAADDPWLCLFARNYCANTGVIASWTVLASLDSTDFVMTLSTLKLVLHISHRLSQLFPTTTANDSKSTASIQALPQLSIHLGHMRLLVPVDVSQHVSTQVLICSEASSIESLPHFEMTMDGTTHPPFRALFRRQRATSSSLHVTQQPKVLLRSGAFYIAFACYDQASSAIGCRNPFEFAMSTYAQKHLSLIKVDYILAPCYFSFEASYVKETLKIAIHLTKLGIEIDHPKLVIVLNHVSLLLSALPVSQLKAQHSSHTEPTIEPFNQLDVVFDGCDVTLKCFESSVYFRMGAVSLSHGVNGHLSLKNVVVGHRRQGVAEEILVFGPLCDPTDWQLEVEKFPDKLVHATWSITQDKTLSGLLEAQGVQCNISLELIETLLHISQSFKVLSSSPSPSVDSWATAPVHNPKIRLPCIGLIDQLSFKLLWAPSQWSIYSKDFKECLSCHTGALFASTDIRANANNGHSTRLTEWSPLKWMDFVVTWQNLSVGIADNCRPIGVALTSQLSRETSWQDYQSLLSRCHQIVHNFDIRCTGDLKQILHEQGGVSQQTNIFPLSAHIECNAIHATVSAMILKSMEKWTLSWSSLQSAPKSSPAKASRTTPKFPHGKTCLNDFVELTRRREPKAYHPRAGELIVTDFITSDTPFSSSMIPISMNKTQDTLAHQEEPTLEELVKDLQEPWSHTNGQCILLRWKYLTPRRLLKILANPLPVQSAPSNWPRMYDRLCFVQCELRYFDVMSGKFESVGLLQVPWEEEHQNVSSQSSPMSFASAFTQWMVDSNDSDAPTLQESQAWKQSYLPREYHLPFMTPALQWELLCRLPTDARDPNMYRELMENLVIALQLTSVADLDAIPQLALACSVPEVKLSWRQGTAVQHELIHVKLNEATLQSQLYASEWSLAVAGVVSSEISDLTTLATTSLLLPWSIRIAFNQKATLESTLKFVADELQLQLTQYALIFLTQLPQLLRATQQEQKLELSECRILIENQTNCVIYYRQLNSNEVNEVEAFATSAYSWHSFDQPLELQFTRAIKRNWSKGYPVHSPYGVWFCPLNEGPIWVDVAQSGLQTQLTIRGDIVVYNHLGNRLQFLLNSSAAVALAESPRSVIVDTMSAQISLRCNPQDAWSIAHTLSSNATPLEPVETSVATQSSELIMLNACDATQPFYMWLVCQRAQALVMKDSSLPSVRRWCWMEVHLWPTMYLFNSLPSPVSISVKSRAFDMVQVLRLSPEERHALLHYDPQQPHALVWNYDGGNPGTIEIPAFASVDYGELQYPVHGVLRKDVTSCGTFVVSRASTKPVREIKLVPSILLKNNLPFEIIVQGDGYFAKVPSGVEKAISVLSFTIGVQFLPDTVLWTPQRVSWDASLTYSALAWPSLKSPGFAYYGVIKFLDATAPFFQRKVFVSPRFVLRNCTSMTLQVAHNAKHAHPKMVQCGDSIWPTGSLRSTSNSSSIHSGIKWIRTRLSRGNSIADDGGMESVPVVELGATQCSLVIAANDDNWSNAAIDFNVTELQRILLRKNMSDIMLTYKVTMDNEVVIATIYEDFLPPVTIQNHLVLPISLSLINSTKSVQIGPNDTITYDWQLQDHLYRVLEPKSVFDPPVSPSAMPRTRFKVRLQDSEDWSSAIWLVEGIQFAKTSNLVFLVTIYKRLAVWMIHIECIDGGIKSSPRVLPQPLSIRPSFSMEINLVSLVICCFDDHTTISIDGCSKYPEIFRIVSSHLVVVMKTNANVPEALKSRYSLGYLNHVQDFTSWLVSISSLELDHFLNDCNFPNILSSGKLTPSSNTLTRDELLLSKSIESFVDSKAFAVRVIQANCYDSKLSYLESIDLAVAPVTVQIEDTLVFKLQAWIAPIIPPLPIESSKRESSLDSEGRFITKQKRYIGHLQIYPISLLITARALYGLDRTPLSLSKVDISHVFCFEDQLAKDLAANYVADALVRSPVLLMSLNVLGNPAGFVRDVSAGFQDLVRLPLMTVSEQGYSPISLTKGLIRGAYSFATHASVATLTSISGVARAVSRSMDHISVPNTKPAAPPANFATGLSSGFQTLGQSVVGAATGVVMTPLNVMRESQELGKPTGFSAGVVGIGKGLVGVVAQPMSGVASLVSMTTDGLLVDMGLGGDSKRAVQTHLPLERNEPLYVRWKLIGGSSILGDIVFAKAIYFIPETLEPLEPPGKFGAEWLLPEDTQKPRVLVTLVVSPIRLYIIDAVREVKLETLALSSITAMEQNLTQPTKLDIGVGFSAMQLAWFRFRLSMADRRYISNVITLHKKW